MLKKFNVTDYKYVQFEKDQTAPWLLYIVQYDSPSYIYKEEIGRFDFYNMEGRLAVPNAGIKEYKRFNAMLNMIFKHDERFGWNYVLVEDCKKAGLKKRKAEKVALAEKEVNKQTEKALEYLNKLNNNDTQLVNVLKDNFMDVTDEQLIKVIKNNFKNAISERLVNEVFNTIKSVLNNIELNEQKEENKTTDNNEDVSYTAFNRTFSTYSEAEAYCISNDFDTEYIKEVAPQQPSNTQPVTYHFYKQSFDNYMDAYNYAINNKSPVTMVIASNHPTMTNERLQQLEKEYTFSKGSMSYNDMKEYFSYISSLNESLDQQERYYKLQSYIKRYEYNQKQKENRKEYLRDLMREACTLLHFMKKKGLQLINKSDCGISSTKYIYNNNVLHFDVRSNGMPIDEYHTMIHNIFNNHFSDYMNEYKQYRLYWYYMNTTNTEPLTQINNYVFTDNTIGEYGIIAYDRQLSDIELSNYNLIPYTPEATQQAI
ncbi:hypothetical protein [Heyndrickxia camelliae]|uniref:Uncharacterized protein n=1 Tax=Heyndrickxia camelliae TaxID=1707093 RepID=A0A2N3LE39_9BACI|nr:hypothetical protein [Heyndrickxia camelliae]PKR82878.1 hypothetical protein CWO92_22065 [Heyndrickxia camelliae]